MKMLIKDPSFAGVSNGSRATVQLPTGWTYHQINLVARKANGVLMTAAEIAAGIGKIYVKKDGVAFIDGIPASVLRDMFGYDFNVWAAALGGTSAATTGQTAALTGDADADGVAVTVAASTVTLSGANQVGIIPLPMSLPKFNTPMERDLFSIGTADVSSLSIEAEITSAVPVTLEVLSVKEKIARPFGMHLSIRPYNDAFTGTGIFETSKMTKDTLGAAYRRSHIYAAGITDVTMFVNNERIFEEVPAELNRMLQIQRGRTPISDVYTLDHTLDDVPSAMLPLPIDDMRLKINFSAAPNSFVIYNVFVEDMPAVVTKR